MAADTTEPFGTGLKMLLRRFYRHLRRSQAVASFLLSFVALLVFALVSVVGGDGPVSETTRELSLIVASLALGTAFLPELSGNLWKFNSEDVRELVPERKIDSLQDAIVHARVEESEWGDAVVGSAIAPLIAAGREPHKIVADFSYSTRVHLKGQAEVDGETRPIRRVETELRARRRLPELTGPSRHYWVSIARDHGALRHEYNRDECLFREVVALDDDLDDEQWRDVVERLSKVKIVIDGHSVDGVLGADPADDPERVVRWYVDEAELDRAVRERCSVWIYVDYPMGAEWNRFLVSFSSYYVMGSAQLRFQLYEDDDQRFELLYEPFLAAALGTPTSVTRDVKDGLCQDLTVVTGDTSLIWPGSGMAVWWRATRGARVAPGDE